MPQTQLGSARVSLIKKGSPGLEAQHSYMANSRSEVDPTWNNQLMLAQVARTRPEEPLGDGAVKPMDFFSFSMKFLERKRRVCFSSLCCFLVNLQLGFQIRAL